MINITQGDVVTLSLRCPDHNLTAATLTTVFQKADGTYLQIEDAEHTIDADQVTNEGVFTVDLTADDTEEIKVGRSTIVTKVEQAGVVRQYHGNDIMLVRSSPFEAAP